MSAPSDITEILWSWGPGESRLALLAGERVMELRIERPEALTGAVFLGRVTAVDRALDAAFLDIGTGERPGFLAGAAALGLTEGGALAVQIRAEARGGKGPKLSADLLGCPPHVLAGIATAKAPSPLWRPHVLERLLAANPGVTHVAVDDAAALAEARRWFPTAERRALPEVEDALDEALTPVVALASGGRLVIEPTAALTAIDVDSGGSRPADANREAVAAIARQTRLRGIGGQIAVDFVSGPKGTPYKLAAALKRAVASDPVPTHVFGVTPLGMVELTRERRGAALAETLCRRHTELTAESLVLTGLRRVLAEADARPGVALALVVAPEVAMALSRLGEAMTETERRLGRALPIRSEPGRSRDDILIEGHSS
ncbi:MAG: ribonuclease E/G [Phaeospirillum sp.]|nr:ribonuclease E/G [Phaeospirillum sp.]